jgi:DNA repair protein RadC
MEDHMNQPTLFPGETGKPKYIPRHKLLPLRERPVERVSACPNACTTSELLAALIGGSRPIEAAEAMLGHFKGSLHELCRASVNEIEALPGIGGQNAARLKAAIELGVRLSQYTAQDIERPSIRSPSDAAALVQHEMSVQDQEYLKVMLLDTRNRVMDVVEVYHGSVNSAQIRVAEVFKEAIRRNAAAIIVIHNHPSGDPTPSPDDVVVTRAIVQAGKLLDMDVLDHILIGQGGKFVSMKEKALGFESGHVAEGKLGYPSGRIGWLG